MNLRRLQIEKLSNKEIIIKNIKKIIDANSQKYINSDTRYNKINNALRAYFAYEEKINYYNLGMPTGKVIINIMLYNSAVTNPEDKQIHIELEW